MKLYELKVGDIFILAGDDSKEEFEVVTTGESYAVKDVYGYEYNLRGFVPVLYRERK